jgi:hypothetical protein
MRAVLAFVVLSGCASAGPGAGTGTSTRPAVMPMLSELPTDASKRDAVLDSSASTAGPEQRKGMTSKERKAETTAATAAAIIGGMFSKTQNATIGSATVFDESVLMPLPVIPEPLKSEDPPNGARKAPAGDETHKDLTPWVKLQPPPQQGTAR